MTNFRRLLFTAGFAIAATGLLSADTLETQTFSLPSGSNATNWTQSAVVNQFNTSLGTLEWISFKVSVNTTVTGTAVDANAGSTGTDVYNFLGTTNMTFGDTADTIILAPTTSVTKTFTGESLGSPMAVTAAPASTTSNAKYSVDTNSALNGLCGSDPGTAGCLASGGPTTADPLDYLAYEGSGNISLTLSAATFAAFSGPSYTGGSGSGTANANVTVVYDYLAAPPPTSPEPATMALFGSGLIGLGLLRRRMVKKS